MLSSSAERRAPRGACCRATSTGTFNTCRSPARGPDHGHVSGESGDEDDFGETHDINVTPFIDVMLVLLIIFMVAAPLSTVDLPIDLPSSTAVPQKKPDKPIYVSLKADLAVAVGETPVKRVDLVQRIDALPEVTKDKRIFLRVDRAVPYGEMMSVLDLLRGGGYTKVALVALEGAAGAEP